MKTRRVTVTIEVDTDASVDTIEKAISETFTDMVGMSECTSVSIQQIQTNVMQNRKKK